MSRSRFKILAAKIGITAPPVAAPVNTVAPVIGGDIGTPAPGSILTVSDGTWTGSPTSFAYQWKKDAVAITGETTAAHTIVAGEVAHNITCTVTATNAGGSTAATSDTIVPQASVDPPVASQLIKPAAEWTGTYGSGFDALSNRPSVMAYTDRTGPMPILQERQEDYHVFTGPGGYLGVTGVMGANCGGLDSVICAIDGAFYSATEMTARTRSNNQAGGADVVEWAYWFQVDTANFTGYGSFEVYFIGVTNDPTYADQVIGPFKHHYLATEFTHTFNIYAGAPNTGFDYTTPLAAFNVIKANATYYNGRPCVELDGGTYSWFNVTSFPADAGFKRVIRAKAGQTVTIAGTIADDIMNVTWKPGVNALYWYGINFDRRYLPTMVPPQVANCKGGQIGCNWLTTHPDGAYGLWVGSTYPGIMSESTGAYNADPLLTYPYYDSYRYFLIDTDFDGVATGPKNAYAFNCNSSALAGDVWGETRGIYNSVITAIDPSPLRTGIDSMTITNATGTPVTFAYQSGTATLIVDGVTHTFSVYSGSQPSAASIAGGNYYVSDLVAKINALAISGLSATTLSDARRASFLEEKDPVDNIPGFTFDVPTTTITAGGVTFSTAIDIHGDMLQFSDGRKNRNVLVCNVLMSTSTALQLFYMTNSQLGQQDMAFINIASSMAETGYSSQLNFATSKFKDHILFWYVAMPQQEFWPRNIPADGGWTNSELKGLFCRRAQGNFSAGAITNSECTKNFKVDTGGVDNAFMAMTYTTKAAAFVNYAGNDYTPVAAGPLLQDMEAPLVPFDLYNTARNALTAWGPVEAA